MKRWMALMLCIFMVVGTLAGCSSDNNSTTTASTGSSNTDYPKQDLQASVMWGAGGALDNSIRALAPYVEKQLDISIIMTNRAGGGGAIAMQYVNEQKDDGYNLLIASEGAQLAKVLDTSSVDLNDFELINIYAGTYGVVLVEADSEYQTLEDLVDDIIANPNQIKMGTAGPASSPFAINAMMTNVHDITPNLITYDGDSAAVTALMGGEVDYTAVSLTSAMSYISGGKLKALAVINDEVLPGLEDVPAITSIYPDYEKFLPWGTFWGIWVKKGTSEDIVKVLSDSFSKAVEEEGFQEFLTTLSAFPLNLTGEEAQAYSDNYQSVTAWLLYDSGAAVNSPEEFDIPRVNE